MGFHIIIPQADGAALHDFIEDISDLAEIDDVNEQTIIYEGTESQKPLLLLNHPNPKVKKYADCNFRLGIRTENAFIKQANEHKFIVNRIDQSLEDFEQYRNSIDDDVKRADFLIKNASVDVDVKCRSIYEDDDDKYFYLRADDVRKHLNMMKHTKTPVIIAVFARLGSVPDENAIYMIEINKIKEAVDKKSISLTKNGYYAIPLSATVEGFELLEKFRNK